MDRDIIIAAFRSGALWAHAGGALPDLQRAAETFADLVEKEQNETEAPGVKRKEVMNRHPYTYAADFMRAHGPSRPIVGDICGPILSRADASYLRHKIAAAIGMSDAELAEKLSLAYQAEQSGTEAPEAKRKE